MTAEDAIEQLTGELEDEFDDPARPVLTTASGALLMDGGVNLRDLETQTQWSLPREGGWRHWPVFMLMRLGHIPRGGESVDLWGPQADGGGDGWPADQQGARGANWKASRRRRSRQR